MSGHAVLAYNQPNINIPPYYPFDNNFTFGTPIAEWSFNSNAEEDTVISGRVVDNYLYHQFNGASFKGDYFGNEDINKNNEYKLEMFDRNLNNSIYSNSLVYTVTIDCSLPEGEGKMKIKRNKTKLYEIGTTLINCGRLPFKETTLIEHADKHVILSSPFKYKGEIETEVINGGRLRPLFWE